MNTIFRQRETDTKSPGGFYAILYWLTRLIQLTEEEQNAAGIYLGNRYDNEHKG